jgi:hypothetical protein
VYMCACLCVCVRERGTERDHTKSPTTKTHWVCLKYCRPIECMGIKS